MPLLRFGLEAGAAVAAAAAAASWLAGYAVEVALLRGLLAFPLVVSATFFAELVVSTAPPAVRAAGERPPLDLARARADRDASADRRAA